MTIPSARIDELLPCPFCGERLIRIGADLIAWAHPVRSLAEAKCPGVGVHIRPGDAEAIAAWNRRQPTEPGEVVPVGWDPLKWVKHVSLDGKDIWFEAKTTICEYIAHPNGRWGCRELSIRERGQGDSLDDAKEAARKHYLALLQGREATNDL